VIYEYRTYTLGLGLLQQYVAAGKYAGLRKNEKYGRLVGSWLSEFGTYHQFHHIWAYPSLDARQAARAELSEHEEWTQKFLKTAWPAMQRQEVRFMTAQTEITPPKTPALFYEARIYRTEVGQFAEGAGAILERPCSGTRFGLWISETPQPNEIVEITAYPDFARRLEDRIRQPEQSAWLIRHQGLFQGVSNMLLDPLTIAATA
jgi:NIPSNAP